MSILIPKPGKQISFGIQINKENKQRNSQLQSLLNDSFLHLNSLKECYNNDEFELDEVINKLKQMNIC